VIVAVDTSSALTSVAVCDGERVLAQREELDARRHAEVLAPLLQEALRDADADGSTVTTVACGVGPGPYTGLRVGIATARALGLAWSRPVVGLCSLDAIAAEVFDATDLSDVCVASDARRREVYWAQYSRLDGRLVGPLVTAPDDIPEHLRRGAWAGQGAQAHADRLGQVIDAVSGYPDAAWIARVVGRLQVDGGQATPADIRLVGHGGDGAATAAALVGATLLIPEPLYLRRPDATEPAALPGVPS
jgi:tRNA threonylcarbamoyladenosine biosynthesis protein TsaB